MSEILILSEADVRRALPMPEAIAAMRPAFAALSSGDASVPVRTPVALPEGLALVMPAAWPDANLAGLKLATVHPSNPANGLPTVSALVLVVRADDGQPVALLSATALTAIRTGAGTGLATELLARSEARVCAVFGAGAQAETQLEAVCAVRAIERALVFNRTRARGEDCALRMTDRLGLPVSVAAERHQLREADVICTATASPTPVFDAVHIKPGAHINGVGTHRQGEAELPPELVRQAYVVVDHRGTCAAEAGDLLGAGLDVSMFPELGEVITGTALGRTDPDQITLFKSVGNAVQDLAAAAHVIRVAEQQGFGQRVAL